MATLTIDGIGAVELDRDGRVEGVGNPLHPSYTEVAELPVALREEIARRVRIVRERMILPDNRPHSYLRGCIDGVDCTGRTIEELLAAYVVRAESVDYVDLPYTEAMRASIILAGDYGHANHLEANDYNGFDVVVDDSGKRFQFRKKG